MPDILPLISVVITTYNREYLVMRAIESALNQSYKHIEVVVIDDASTDQTIAQIESLQNSKIRLIVHPKNLGASAAKNSGVRNATGDYIAFLDSDDLWLPNKLELQFQALQQHQNVPLCFTATRVHRSHGDGVVRIARKNRNWYHSIIHGESVSLGSTLLAKKSCIEEVGPLDASLIRFEDRDWCLRYLRIYPDFIYLEEPLAEIYNSGWPTAAIVTHSANQFLALQKPHLSSCDYGILCSSMRFEIAVSHWREGRKPRAFTQLISACIPNPYFLGYLIYRIGRKIRQSDFF